MKLFFRDFIQQRIRSALVFAILAQILLSSAGCNSTGTRNEAVAAAKLGSDISNVAITIYGKIDGLSEKEIQLQNEINIIVSPPGAADQIKFKAPNASLGEELSQRIAAYSQLGKAYAQFSLLASTDFSGQAQEAVTALNSAIDKVNGIKGLKSGQVQSVSGLTGLIVSGVQAGKIKDHNKILWQVAKGFSASWIEDEPILIDYVKTIYQSYADGLDGLRLSSFDSKRLRDSTSEPFRDDILAGLYKLEKRKHILAECDAVVTEIKAVGVMLTKLVRVHGELSKKEPSLAETLQTIDQVLAQIEKLKK